MYEGKLKIVSKVYNLSQRFVQELNESIAETTGLINEQKNSHSSRGQSYDQLQSMLAVPTMTNISAGLGSIDEDMDSDGKFDRDLGGSKKRGQSRGLDGKFESQLMKDLDDDITDNMPLSQEQDYGKGKGRSKGMSKRVEKIKVKNEPFEITGQRKRKGRGAVANVFYEGSQQSM